MDSSSNKGIISVIVIPYNEKWARYIINDGETRAKPYDEILDLLKDLVPRKKFKIVLDFVHRFRTFAVLVEEERIEELHFDFDKELKALRKETLQEIINPKEIDLIFSKEHLNKDRSVRSQSDALKRKFMKR